MGLFSRCSERDATDLLYARTGHGVSASAYVLRSVVGIHTVASNLTVRDNARMQLLTTIPLSLQTILLLIGSNVFMTFAWYGHLKNLAAAPWYTAALVSWGIALFEYLLQVPANRIGFQQAQLSVAQLKIMQEVITLVVFVPFAMVYLKQPFKLDFVWAALCLVGAVYFVFRSAG